MEIRSVLKAARRISLAEKQLARLHEAQTYEEMEQEWYLLLVCTHSAYTLLCQGHSRSSDTDGWFETMVKAMHEHPVLEYMHHARNDEEHGIERSTSIGFAVEMSGDPIYRMSERGYLMQGLSPSKVDQREFMTLVAVRDNSPKGKQKKRIVKAPTVEQLNFVDPDKRAQFAASIQIEFLKDFIEEAAKRV